VCSDGSKVGHNVFGLSALFTRQILRSDSTRLDARRWQIKVVPLAFEWYEASVVSGLNSSQWFIAGPNQS
jgi:hypothetical protein